MASLVVWTRSLWQRADPKLVKIDGKAICLKSALAHMGESMFLGHRHLSGNGWWRRVASPPSQEGVCQCWFGCWV